MNGTFVFVLLIIAIVMGARIIQTYLRQRGESVVKDEEIQETYARLDKLEERIRVLERIITENRYDLRNEIDAL